MPDDWDISLKLLFKERPQDLIQWLMPQATYQKSVSAHLPGRKLDADTLHEVLAYEEPALVHVEFQSYRETDMGKRLWQYNVRATNLHDLPVYSFVMYLKPQKHIARSPYIRVFPGGRQVHRFDFGVVCLWEIPVEALRQTGLVGVLPLLCLTQGGQHLEIVDEAIAEIQRAGGESEAELLALTHILTALVFTKEHEQSWLRRRFGAMRDILRDTWAYKDIKQEGLDEGLRKGLQKGLQKGRQEAQQEALQEQRLELVEFVRGRFPSLESLTRDTVAAIAEPRTLRHLLVKVSLAPTEEAVRQVLLEQGKIGH